MDVLFVDPPISKATARLNPDLSSVPESNAVHEVATGIYRIVPWVIPGKDRPGLLEVTSAQSRRVIRSALRRLGREPSVFIQTLPQRQLFTAERSCTSVYWAKDDHIAGARLYGWDPKRLGRKERRLATSADLVIVCSDALADRWRSEGVEAAVLHNGVDVNHFERSAIAREDSAITADHTIIYIGTVTSRVDADLILKVADAGHPVTLVGGVRATQEWDDFALLHQHQRVRMVGPRSYDELPDYLAAASVGIVPYKVDRYNIGSFPLKILEYLAAGLPVVSTDLPAARQFEGRHVTVATTAEEFVQAVGSASRSGFSKSTVAARRGIAKENDWNKRADQFLRLLGLP